MENTEIKLAEFYENTDKWENRELGADEEFASLANEADDDELMSLLNEPEDENIDSKMQLISIRLPQTLIADLKKIGKSEDLGYQTLAREVLKRFVDAENRKKYNEAIYEKEKAMAENRRLAEELEAIKKRNAELHAKEGNQQCG
jgi:predicted DNA binding CopG/RHH family protein|tara:strand:+ start:772 stop:1206 length:435 start_codon:yes stop_codon:yes gene_type:complete